MGDMFLMSDLQRPDALQGDDLEIQRAAMLR